MLIVLVFLEPVLFLDYADDLLILNVKYNVWYSLWAIDKITG